MNLEETLELAAVSTESSNLVLEIQDIERVHRIAISATPIVLGSARSADVVIADRTVSGRHCQIHAHAGGIRVKDLGSRNGTYVGSARVEEAWGTVGMTVLIGQTTIVCIDIAEAEAVEKVEPLPGIAGSSAAMCRVATQVRRLAMVRAPVLIAGETGVGKELVAKAIHLEGNRRSGAFVALNASTLPRELVESELFGHERGAFTGATTTRIGAFSEAEGGTLFLDEVGELPIDAQPKLLRALDGYEVRRIGAQGGRKADVRVIAATHVPLLDRVKAGLFRRDLYHRLEVFVIEIPPLRDRPGDILSISRTLLENMADEYGEFQLTQPASAYLAGHDWPGNVRELRNVLARSSQFAIEGLIDMNAIIRGMRKDPSRTVQVTAQNAARWLAAHGGNVSAAARAANMPRTTFRKLLAKPSQE